MRADLSQNDSDTFWHIELGRWMIDHNQLVTHAIHTFAGEHLPYVPHEIGFQLILGALYKWAEWDGVHLLTLVCVGLLAVGYYRLMMVSRLEMGLRFFHPFLIFLIVLVVEYIYMLYFTIRPQMVSSPVIVWFMVYLREFQYQPNGKKGIKLGILSLLLANIHGGVWPVILVFYGMALVEHIIQKKINKWHGWTLLWMIIGGLFNPGGWSSLLYFHTVSATGFENWIREWQPINYREDPYYLVVIGLFLWSAMQSANKSIFRLVLMIGLLYLGVSNYKQHLYLVLLLPYFLAGSIDRIPWLMAYQKERWMIQPRFLWSVLFLGLTLNGIWAWFIPYSQPYIQYPVQEMDFILEKSNQRPKVFASYGSSGYIMFRGGDILADGRFDPFVTEETKGIHQWTAFERSLYALESDQLIEMMKLDQPDYLILPHEVKKNTIGEIEVHEVRKKLGSPLYEGSYGSVWKVKEP